MIFLDAPMNLQSLSAWENKMLGMFIVLSIFIGWIAIMSYCICGMIALANSENWGFKHWFERVGGSE